METILVFSGGPFPDSAMVSDLPEADLVVAADSGYDVAMLLGFRVDVVVGDMDSIQTDSLPDHVIVEKHPRDKDNTDLDLAIELSMREEPSRLVIVAGTGGRHDHALATAMIICSERWRQVDEIDWISDRSRNHVVRQRRMIHGDVGSTLTMLAMGGFVDGVTTQGLKWELTGATLEPGQSLGISNVMERPVVDINVEHGTLLVMLPY
jgi:thiamine pyrophosphokinase